MHNTLIATQLSIIYYISIGIFLQQFYIVAFNAWSISQSKSFISSIPTDILIISGLTPAAACSSSLSWACVVLAGCITNDFASATFARWENIWRLSINFFPASSPPFIPNVNIEPAPFGKYFCPNS